jgi:transmembrane sensor
MEEINEKALTFVVRYYQEGKLDTRKAIKAFMALTGQSTRVMTLRRISIAASIALLIGISSVWYLSRQHELSTLSASDRIAIYVLPDESRITLAPHSTIIYDEEGIKEGDRQLTLHGKAYFEVHHDAAHPFEVYGRVGHVKVLGTVFQVDEQRAKMSRVYVESGKVRFSAVGSNQSVVLTRGMRAELLARNGKPHVVSAENTNDASWATNVFRYRDAPIGEVLRQLSDYYHVNLSTADTSKRLSGEFEATDLRKVKGMLEDMLCIKITVAR